MRLRAGHSQPISLYILAYVLYISTICIYRCARARARAHTDFLAQAGRPRPRAQPESEPMPFPLSLCPHFLKKIFLLHFRFWGTCAEHARQLHRYTHGNVVYCLPPHHLYLAFLPMPSVWRFLKDLEIEIPFGPAIPLLGIYAKDYKAFYYKDTCTWMFIPALFTIAKIWN